MHILVTGAGGFIGFELTKRLMALEYKVTTISRNFYSSLEDLGVTQLQFDLTNNPSQLKKILEKHHHTQPIKVIFHVASKVSMWGKWIDFYKTNVVATENLVKVAQELNIKSFVYTSTPSVVYSGNHLNHENEKLPYTTSKESLYAYSKSIAERFVLKQNSKSFKTIALRPHLVFGQGDKNLIPTILKKAQTKKLRIIGSGKNLVDITYIDNVIDAHICALNALENSQKARGEAFFIGQGPTDLWSFIDLVLEKKGLEKVRKKIPYRLAYVMSFLCELIYSILFLSNKEPPSTRFVVNQLSKNHYFDHQKAKSLLNWQPNISTEEGLRRLFKS